MATKMVHPYITEDKDIGRGKPIIKGTRTRVSNLIAYYKLGYTAEELEQMFPHLSLAKIYDCLSFYHENQEEVDKEIEADKEANFMNDND